MKDLVKANLALASIQLLAMTWFVIKLLYVEDAEMGFILLLLFGFVFFICSLILFVWSLGLFVKYRKNLLYREQSYVLLSILILIFLVEGYIML